MVCTSLLESLVVASIFLTFYLYSMTRSANAVMDFISESLTGTGVAGNAAALSTSGERLHRLLHCVQATLDHVPLQTQLWLLDLFTQFYSQLSPQSTAKRVCLEHIARWLTPPHGRQWLQHPFGLFWVRSLPQYITALGVNASLALASDKALDLLALCIRVYGQVLSPVQLWHDLTPCFEAVFPLLPPRSGQRALELLVSLPHMPKALFPLLARWCRGQDAVSSATSDNSAIIVEKPAIPAMSADMRRYLFELLRCKMGSYAIDLVQQPEEQKSDDDRPSLAPYLSFLLSLALRPAAGTATTYSDHADVLTEVSRSLSSLNLGRNSDCQHVSCGVSI